jgi:addiction module HigA family antidote
MREILDEHVTISISEAARRMDVSRPALYAVLGGESAVTPEMALKFAKLTGGSPDLYVHMQVSRDLWIAERDMRDALARIEPAA